MLLARGGVDEAAGGDSPDGWADNSGGEGHDLRVLMKQTFEDDCMGSTSFTAFVHPRLVNARVAQGPASMITYGALFSTFCRWEADQQFSMHTYSVQDGRPTHIPWSGNLLCRPHDSQRLSL